MLVEKVFLDSNIVISAGTRRYGPEFARVIDLINTKRISILTTNLTVEEVIRHHVRRDFDKLKIICDPFFCRKIRESVDVEIPTIEEAQLRHLLKRKYRALVRKMFKDMGARVLKVSEAKTKNVFSDYINERGFFADGSGKRDQFPDAVVLELLKDEASASDPIIIVSKDNDFERPVKDQEHISLFKSLPDLFDELGLRIEVQKIEEFLEQNYEILTEMVDKQLSDLAGDGYIEYFDSTEVEINEIEIQNPGTFKPAETGGPILVVAWLYVTIVDFGFLDESASMQDSDEKHGINFDTKFIPDMIDSEIEVSITIKVDDKGEPVDIEELEIRNEERLDIRFTPDHEYW